MYAYCTVQVVELWYVQFSPNDIHDLTQLSQYGVSGVFVSILPHPSTCSKMASLKIKRRPKVPRPVFLKYSYCSKEYQFISKDKSLVRKYLCPICQEILYEPVQTSCGHLFCGKCLKKVRWKNCPSCRAEFEEEPRRDKFNEREIRNLIVKCQNSSRGCEWEGELGNVESHQNGICEYQLVQCGNKCGAEIERRDVEKHKKDHCELRMYECPYCPHWSTYNGAYSWSMYNGAYSWSTYNGAYSWSTYKGTYKKVISEHFKECAAFPLDCPNNCEIKGIRRRDMSSHLALCPEEVVPCRYQSLGCKVRLPREQMKDHLKDKDTHLDIAMVTTSELVTKLNKVESKHSVSISTLQKQVDALLKKTSTEVVLPPPVPPPKPWLKEDLFPRYPPCTLRVELHKDRRGVTPHFFSHPGGYGLELRVGGNMSNYIIDPVDHPDNYPLKWPIEITVNYVLLNQEEDKDHVHRECSRRITSPKDISRKSILFKDIPPRCIKDNSLYIKITRVDVQ